MRKPVASRNSMEDEPRESEQVEERCKERSERSQTLQVKLSFLALILSDMGLRKEEGQDMVFILEEHSDCCVENRL